MELPPAHHRRGRPRHREGMGTQAAPAPRVPLPSVLVGLTVMRAGQGGGVGGTAPPPHFLSPIPRVWLRELNHRFRIQ